VIFRLFLICLGVVAIMLLVDLARWLIRRYW
jgi:hypothetical protein